MEVPPNEVAHYFRSLMKCFNSGGRALRAVQLTKSVIIQGLTCGSSPTHYWVRSICSRGPYVLVWQGKNKSSLSVFSSVQIWQPSSCL